MRIPGTSIEISANRAPAPRNVLSTNSYEDSVAGKLADRYGRSASVSANGRAVGAAYNDETIQEIYQGYIFGAIKKTRNQVAEILSNNVEVFNPKDGNPSQAPALDKRHPYMDAIENADMDNSLFYAGIATYLIVLGEAFIDAGLRTMAAGNIVPVGALNLMQSNRVVRTYDNDGKLATYKLSERLPNGTDKFTHYVPSNVVAIIDLNPWDLRKGYGMIRPIVDKVALENMATKLQTATIANGIKAPGILSTKEKVGKDEYDDLVNSVQTRYTSNDMERAGTPIVTNGGFVDYKSLIEDLDKLAMIKIRNMNRDAFFAALSVSKTILGIEESGTTREVARVQREQFILDACMPLANAILSGLNQDYKVNYPKDYQRDPLKMRAVAPIEKDTEQEKAEAEIYKLRAETYKVYIDSGMDPDQAAELAELELAEGTKVKTVEKPAAANTIVLTDDQLRVISGRNEAPGATPTINVDNSSHVHQHSPADLAQTAKNVLTDKERTRIEKAEQTLRNDLATLDGELGEQYVSSVNNLDKDKQAAYIAELTNVLMAYYAVAVPIFGKNRAAMLATDFNEAATQFVFNEQVRQIVRERLGKVANAHFATLDAELTNVITDATRDGLQRDAVIKAVREKVENEVVKWEVERLVQTETSNAFNQATYLSDKQFITEKNYVGRAYKVWRTNSPKPCPFCTSQAGRREPFETDFFKVGDVAEGTKLTVDGKEKPVYYPVRFVDVNAGGLHPNCHCDYKLEIV